MDQMAVENCSIISAKESLPKFGVNDRQAGFLPSLILPEIYRTKSGKVVFPRYTQEERALRWALDRLAGWNLPGKRMLRNIFGACIGGTSDATYASALMLFTTSYPVSELGEDLSGRDHQAGH